MDRSHQKSGGGKCRDSETLLPLRAVQDALGDWEVVPTSGIEAETGQSPLGCSTASPVLDV